MTREQYAARVNAVCHPSVFAPCSLGAPFKPSFGLSGLAAAPFKPLSAPCLSRRASSQLISFPSLESNGPEAQNRNSSRINHRVKRLIRSPKGRANPWAKPSRPAPCCLRSSLKRLEVRKCSKARPQGVKIHLICAFRGTHSTRPPARTRSGQPSGRGAHPRGRHRSCSRALIQGQRATPCDSVANGDRKVRA
jgi:hypothetical protein